MSSRKRSWIETEAGLKTKSSDPGAQEEICSEVPADGLVEEQI